MTSIGERLRRQRLQNQISLEKISLDTKIGIRLLEAIEAEQFEKLPGGVFRRSFVLQYAHALGVDADEIAGALKQLNQFDDVPAVPSPETMGGREPQSSSPMSFRLDTSGFSGSTVGSLLAAVGVILLCALVYTWWQTPRQTASASILEAEQAASTKFAPPAPTPQPAPQVQEANSAPQASVPTPAPADSGAAVRVGVSADEKTWVSISTDGKNVFSDALQPHQTKMVEASSKVRLLIGNAGGVEISLNGKPIGPVGPRGQIRVVELTPAGFQIVPRKPPTSEPL
jgi:cytoskeleton protein RodZ